MLHIGDCRDVLPTLPAASVDACVTDPPYGLQFMGKGWDAADNVAFRPETWAAVWRVMKPGAWLLSFGGTRTQHRMVCAVEDAGFVIHDTVAWMHGQGFPKSHHSLKPALELVCLARKPRRGMSVLNIDACRLPHGDDLSRYERSATSGFQRGGIYGDGDPILSPAHPGGRWPANVVLDDEAAAMLDAQSGDRRSAGDYPTTYSDGRGYNGVGAVQGPLYGDTGGASRFFYCAKASTAERNRGLEGRNPHPTVKPLALVRWLVRLIAPLGGIVLDPFLGSGTTAIAAQSEGFRWIGIERDPEYAEIARQRIGLCCEVAS
jgi:site-specific DNA-methyltransferase (adenine-specific)